MFATDGPRSFVRRLLGAKPRGLVVALTLSVVMGLSACGDSDSGSGAGDTSGGGSSSDGKDAAGIAEAKTIVEAHSTNDPLELTALSAAPPTGKKVAWVNCSVLPCNPGGMDEPAKALGWDVENYMYDLSKGPQDFAKALDAAIATKPDYLMVTFGFPEETVADQLQKAEDEGIFVVDVAGKEISDGMDGIVLGQKAFGEQGALGADLTLAESGGPTEVVMPTDETIPSFSASVAGYQSEMSDKSPSSKVDVLKLSLATASTDNVSQIINYVRTHRDLKWLVFAGGSALEVGVPEALKSSGLDAQVKVMITSVSPNDIPAIKDGGVAVGVAGEAHYYWKAIDIAARNSVGDDFEQEPQILARVVTADNASEEILDPIDFDKSYLEAWGVS